MGNKLELLKESYELLLEVDEILKENFDYEIDIKDGFLDEENEIITIKDDFGSYIQYDVYDCYTALIKVSKLYNDTKIHNIWKRLKRISIEAEIIHKVLISLKLYSLRL